MKHLTYNVLLIWFEATQSILLKMNVSLEKLRLGLVCDSHSFLLLPNWWVIGILASWNAATEFSLLKLTGGIHLDIRFFFILTVSNLHLQICLPATVQSVELMWNGTKWGLNNIYAYKDTRKAPNWESNRSQLPFIYDRTNCCQLRKGDRWDRFLHGTRIQDVSHWSAARLQSERTTKQMQL